MRRLLSWSGVILGWFILRPSISILTYAITLMTKKTAITAAAALLIAGVGSAVYTATKSKDAPSSGGAAGSQSQLATGESTGMDSPAPARSKFHERQAAKDKTDAYGDLVSTYGESRVKLAKRITASVIGLLGPDGIGGLAAVMVEQTEKENLDDLGKKLALNDSQKQQVRDVYQKFQARQSARLTTELDRLKSESRGFSEMLLAGDAYKRNKISKSEYDEITSQFDLGGMDKAITLIQLDPDATMTHPEFIDGLKPLLDPSQLELLEKEIARTPAKSDEKANGASTASLDLSVKEPDTLENIDTKVNSMAVMMKGFNAAVEGMKSLQDATRGSGTQ